jgi:hypothetical protein
LPFGFFYYFLVSLFTFGFVVYALISSPVAFPLPHAPFDYCTEGGTNFLGYYLGTGFYAAVYVTFLRPIHPPYYFFYYFFS